jgi:DASS family divalent anion:Na+ symporter
VKASEEHPDEIALQEQLLRRIDYLQGLDRVDIARLIGASEDVHFGPGAVLVEEGTVAESLYLLGRAAVDVSVEAPGAGRTVNSITAPATLGDFGLLLPKRTATVRAVTEVQAWRIPREAFERLLRERPGLGLAIARSLAGAIDERDRARVGAPQRAVEAPHMMAAPPQAHRSLLIRIVSVALSIGVPALLWFLPAPAGLSESGWHIAAVMAGAAIAWLLEPLPDFAVALAMVVAWAITGLASPALAFSGFTSSAWITALAALGISAAMASSGLLFRTALLMLRLFPPTHRGQATALLLGGVVLTPVVPAVFGRISAVAPVARELSSALGYARASRGSASLAFAGILGNTVLGPVFLTGVVTNFLILGLLPAAAQARFTWIGWLAAALPTAVLLLAGIAALLIALDPHTPARVSQAVRSSQERSLGRLTRQEVVSLAALGVFVLGLAVEQAVRFDIAVVGLAALLVAIGGGAIDRQAFRSGIDWATLVLFGVLLGSGAVLRAGGVDHWLANTLAPVASSLGSPALTVLLLAAFVVAVRLVLPMVPAGFILLITLVPAAPRLGLSAWVVGFVCSLAVFTWILPRQYEVLRMVRQLTEGELFSDRQAMVVGAVVTGVVMLAVVISVPYWRAIGAL